MALLYLFCVVAPGAALALGDVVACLPTKTAAHVHDHSSHDHSAHDRSQAHADTHATDSGETKQQHHGKGSPGPCCAMLCLSGIAADLPTIAKPVQPKSVRVAEHYPHLPDKAPPPRYRPPIA